MTDDGGVHAIGVPETPAQVTINEDVQSILQSVTSSYQGARWEWTGIKPHTQKCQHKKKEYII